MWDRLFSFRFVRLATQIGPKLMSNSYSSNFENVHISNCCFVQFSPIWKWKTCFWSRNVPFVWFSLSMLVMYFLLGFELFYTSIPKHCFASYTLLLFKVEKLLLLFSMCQSILFFVNNKTIDMFFKFPWFPFSFVFCGSFSLSHDIDEPQTSLSIQLYSNNDFCVYTMDLFCYFIFSLFSEIQAMCFKNSAWRSGLKNKI